MDTQLKASIEYWILLLDNIKGLSNVRVFDVVKNIETELTDSSSNIEYIIMDECNKYLKTPISIEDLSIVKAETKLIIKNCQKHGIHWISYMNEKYPQGLKELSLQSVDVPPVLYFKGDITPINQNRNIAVIGTREPLDESLGFGYQISKKLSDQNINIISGLAKGCDTIAHQGALDGKHQYTVAVMAGGLDRIYPEENRKLAEDIIKKGGCLISEYEPYRQPQAWTFAQRDRIQSGISESIVVLQTKVKGGTMITVDYAKKQGRKVYAIDNKDIELSPYFSGNKKILDEFATPLPQDIDEMVKLIIANKPINILVNKDVEDNPKSIYESFSKAELLKIIMEKEIEVRGIYKLKKEDLVKILEKHKERPSLFTSDIND